MEPFTSRKNTKTVFVLRKLLLLLIIIFCSTIYLVLIGIQVYHQNPFARTTTSSLERQPHPQQQSLLLWLSSFTEQQQYANVRSNQTYPSLLLKLPLSINSSTAARALPSSVAYTIATAASTTTTTTNQSSVVFHNNDLDELSSVDYYACCGLGHRLVRMSLAADVAQRHQLELRAFWGFCGNEDDNTTTTEVFSHLFRPLTRSELVAQHVNFSRTHTTIQFHNEVVGYGTLTRRGKGIAACYCTLDKIQQDVRFYSNLRHRFRLQPRLQHFMAQHGWHNHTVIGLHVRAGNGEGGDFVYKGRGIANPNQWVHSISNLIRRFWQNATATTTTATPLNPLLYIATDTPSMIPLFRKELEQHDNMPVLDLPQHRVQEGKGVMFGAFQSVTDRGDKCLTGWEDTVMDMMLLSYAHVVIAGTPSSFTQTLPMSLAFGQRKPHVLPVTFCEVRPATPPPTNTSVTDRNTMPQNYNNFSAATTIVATSTSAAASEPWLQCFDEYMDWCCHHKTWLSFPHRRTNGKYVTISREYIKFLRPEIRPHGRTYVERYRPQHLDYVAWRPIKGNTTKNTFLPREWK